MLGFSQTTVTSIIKDADTGELLDVASVVNVTNRAFVYSNEKGVFTITAKPTDTLYIERLGYKALKIQAAAIKPITFLSTDIASLDLITIVAKKPIALGEPIDGSLLMGLSYLGSYGFKIQMKENSIVEELVVPIKMKAGYAKLGTITFQPYSIINDHELGLPLASPLIITNIDELRKEIRLNFNDFTTTNGQFYLLVNRFLPESQVDENATSFSLNPYLKCAVNGEEWDYMYKYAGDTSWTSSKPFFKVTRPKLAVRVLGRVVE